MIERARGARAVFPPEQVAEVTAIACELPATFGLPLSRLSRTPMSTAFGRVEDDPSKPERILTVRGVGYRLVPGDDGGRPE